MSCGIHRAVKEENPAAYLLGENFFDGTRQLQGDKLDATMNYAGFSKPVWYWLNRFQVNQHGEPHHIVSEAPWSTAALAETWQAYAAAIPWTIARQQFNLLGSHDTPRILEIVGGDLARNRLAAGLLLTYVGVPSIYYGDEIGLAGDNRAPMPWDSAAWNQELRAFYQALIRLRRTSPALIAGGFQVLSVEEGTICLPARCGRGADCRRRAPGPRSTPGAAPVRGAGGHSRRRRVRGAVQRQPCNRSSRPPAPPVPACRHHHLASPPRLTGELDSE